MSSQTRPDLFDMKLRAMRRDRAVRIGPELFLAERAFQDIVERIALIQRNFERVALIGCPDPAWRDSIASVDVDIWDPGPLFAAAARGEALIEDQWTPPADTYDLIVAIGTLDTVNDLPRALQRLRSAMRSDALFIGAIAGGDTLPQLRGAMRAADSVTGAAAPHVHPRIAAAMLAPLLEAAGFAEPVVDVDRVAVSYRSLGGLLADLRAMGATNVLAARPRNWLPKRALIAGAKYFADAGNGERTTEVFEILHFAAWNRGG